MKSKVIEEKGCS